MADNLTLSLIQVNLSWENKDANLQVFEDIIMKLDNTDLIVLPEMFPTGFSMNPEGNYEYLDGGIVDWMIKMSRTSGAAICGSLIIRENEEYYNRFICVDRDKIIAQYNGLNCIFNHNC